MEKTLVGRTKLNQLLFLAAERLLYAPAFQALSLYTLAIFEVNVCDLEFRSNRNVKCSIAPFQGKTHDMAVQNLMQLYWPILKANWTYLSLLVFINIKFVPPMVSAPTKKLILIYRKIQ